MYRQAALARSFCPVSDELAIIFGIVHFTHVALVQREIIYDNPRENSETGRTGIGNFLNMRRKACPVAVM